MRRYRTLICITDDIAHHAPLIGGLVSEDETARITAIPDNEPEEKRLRDVLQNIPDDMPNMVIVSSDFFMRENPGEIVDTITDGNAVVVCIYNKAKDATNIIYINIEEALPTTIGYRHAEADTDTYELFLRAVRHTWLSN